MLLLLETNLSILAKHEQFKQREIAIQPAAQMQREHIGGIKYGSPEPISPDVTGPELSYRVEPYQMGYRVIDKKNNQHFWSTSKESAVNKASELNNANAAQMQHVDVQSAPSEIKKGAIGKLSERINQFIDELKGKNLTPEQQGIYDVFTRKEKPPCGPPREHPTYKRLFRKQNLLLPLL